MGHFDNLVCGFSADHIPGGGLAYTGPTCATPLAREHPDEGNMLLAVHAVAKRVRDGQPLPPVTVRLELCE
ncbi:MAG TPA: hypothetical protein GXX30_02265 [Firmicutes bacterium]|nr:hypothetical protein [Candidatus Fermentithermobacillaceae bacterium]